MDANETSETLSISTYTSSKGVRYCYGTIAGLYVMHLAPHLRPLFANGSVLIIQFHCTRPPGSWVENVLRDEASSEEDARVGEGWVLASGNALHCAMDQGFLIEWAQIYLFTARPRSFVPPPEFDYRCFTDVLPSALIAYLDSTEASGFLADGVVDDYMYTGCNFIFREDVVGKDAFRAIITQAEEEWRKARAGLRPYWNGLVNWMRSTGSWWSWRGKGIWNALVNCIRRTGAWLGLGRRSRR